MTDTFFRYVLPGARLPPEVLFPHFARLPAELQHKIWEEALPPSRIVQVSFSEDRGTFIPVTSPPAVLSVCHISRRIALSRYKSLDIGSSPVPIPFDFNVDKLYVSGITPVTSIGGVNFLISMTESPIRENLRWLYIDSLVFSQLFKGGCLTPLGRMSKLEQVGLVVAYDTAYQGRGTTIDLVLAKWFLFSWRGRPPPQRPPARKKVAGGIRGVVRVRTVSLTRDGKMV